MPLSYQFDHRELCFSFVVDCSIDVEGNMVVYEVQSTESENFTNALNPIETAKKHDEQYHLWINYFREKFQHHFMLDILPELNGKKHFQRSLLASNPNTKLLNPKHIVFSSRDVLKSDSTNFLYKLRRFFLETPDIVIKAAGDNGRKNIFMSVDTENDRTFKEKIFSLMNESCYETEYFTAETQVMHNPLPEDCEELTATERMGAYLRYLVFYYPKFESVESYPVYQNILNVRLSVNSHDLNRKVNLKEVAYLLSYSPDALHQKAIAERDRYPARQKNLLAHFKQISAVFFQFTLAYQAQHHLPKVFIHWFHQSDPRRYYAFFTYEAMRYFISNDQWSFQARRNHSPAVENKRKKDYIVLESIIIKLKDFFDAERIEPNYENLGKIKAEFYQQLKQIAGIAGALSFSELSLLHCLVSLGRMNTKAIFRPLWHQSGMFWSYKKEIYGNTTTAIESLALLEDAMFLTNDKPNLMRMASSLLPQESHLHDQVPFI